MNAVNQTSCPHLLSRRHREIGQRGTFGRLVCLECGKLLEDRSAGFIPYPVSPVVQELLDGAV